MIRFGNPVTKRNVSGLCRDSSPGATGPMGSGAAANRHRRDRARRRPAAREKATKIDPATALGCD
jgi:hypothetical protein